MITTLLWDIDGTLLDFLKSENYGIKKCFEVFGLGECTDEMIERYSAINRKHWAMLERGEETKQQVLSERFREFFANEGIAFDCIDELNVEYQMRLGDKFFFCDNALETLKALKDKYKQYAVTNGTYLAQSRKLIKSGLIDIFDDVFISDKLGFEKPAIEFFDKVQEKIGKFQKDQVMIIGDSLSSDMKGGNNANIICCWYNPNKAENKNNIRIDYEITDISQVLDMLK